MAYAVFAVEKEKIAEMQKILADDMVSRQSIVTRDAKALGFEKDVQYAMVEGGDEGVARAVELFGQAGIQKEADAEAVYKKIKAEEESAADGMGMIFG